METGIKRPNVYLYMKQREKRLVPNAESTAKIVKALHDKGLSQVMYPILKPAFDRMLAATSMCLFWVNVTERVGKRNNRISESEKFVELEKTCKKIHSSQSMKES